MPIDHRETYLVIRDVVHEVDVSGQTELEALEDQPHRWWTAEEIRASDETFVPADLADLLQQLLVTARPRGRRASSPEDVAQ